MSTQEKRLFCRLDGLTALAREQQRSKTALDLGLFQTESIPVFEEATQTVAQVLETPISILGVMEGEKERLKSAFGLSRLGLMNELATSRQLDRAESFCTYVVDSQQPVAITDTLEYPVFANSLLTHQYGIRSYLGVPLVTSSGLCIGTLAVMDVVPRSFCDRDVAFLQLMARWCMSEHEKNSTIIGKAIDQSGVLPSVVTSSTSTTNLAIANQLKVELLNYLTQELRTPLTSVLGMTSVLNREIYGPLTGKQKEYLNIIHNSGQYLLSLLNEIIGLSEFSGDNHSSNLSPIDIEMLCQQVINTLEHVACRREQQIRLTIEPGRRIWLVDKEKVRQILYHLIFSVMQSATAGSIVRLHVSRKNSCLNLSIWVFHPWLGEGLPYVEVASEPSLVSVTTNGKHEERSESTDVTTEIAEVMEKTVKQDESIEHKFFESPQKNLGLQLSQQLIALHGGQINIQGSAESGYRYVISLPQPTTLNEE